jgi:hypothetical protein
VLSLNRSHQMMLDPPANNFSMRDVESPQTARSTISGGKEKNDQAI